MDIERGQIVTGRKKLSIQTGMSEQSIRTSINRLKSTNEITIKSTTSFTVITICNYDRYQAGECQTNQQINQQINQQPNQRSTNDQPTINQQLTTSKERKKERREERKEERSKSLCSEQTICTEQDVRHHEPGTVEALQHVDITGTADEYIERLRGMLNAMPSSYWQDMQKDYPSINVEAEKMIAFKWLKENTSKRKKMVHKYFVGWMRRAALRAEKKDQYKTKTTNVGDGWE
jgi:hypothetical protein